MLRRLFRIRRLFRRGLGLLCLGLCGFLIGLGLGSLVHTELAGLRHFFRKLFLDRVTDRDPATLGARHRPFDQDEAALDIGLYDFEIEGGDTLHAEMAGHLLVFESLAGVLTATGTAD